MPTVYITAPIDAADEIAGQLVGERLAACVNVVDCDSTYRWGGEVHQDAERILFAKTTEEACENLIEFVEEIHPYEVPCIERFEESRVAGPFAQWREQSIE